MWVFRFKPALIAVGVAAAIGAALLAAPVALAQPTQSAQQQAPLPPLQVALPPPEGIVASGPPPSLADQIPAYVVHGPERDFVTLTVENDMFGGGTDQHYTNGVQLTYFRVGQTPPRMAGFLEKTLPFFDVNQTTSSHYSIGQTLFTPDDITVAQPQPNDRPSAGFLYGSAGFSTVEKNWIDDVEVVAGIVGPWAFGEETQKTVHRWVDAPKPQGWSSQLENEPVIMLNAQRRWPMAAHARVGEVVLRAAPHVAASVGNLYTYAGVGGTVQLLPEEFQWQSAPSRIRPAIPGNGLFSGPPDKLGWMLFAGVEGRAMLHNIFLDGNTFADSASVNKHTFVGDANLGAALMWNQFRASYTLTARTPEFSSQQENDLYGVFSFGIRF